MKISGLGGLTRQLQDAQRALEQLDGELGSVSFDPHDPMSIEAAIKRMEAIVDERVRGFDSNLIIGPLAEQMKEQYRKAILERAAAARLAEGEK